MKNKIYAVVMIINFYHFDCFGNPDLASTSSDGTQSVNSLKDVEKKRKNPVKKDIGKIPGIPVELIDIACDNDGYPTLEALKQLLVDKFINKIVGQDLNLKIVGGGYWTERMYCVSLSSKPDSAIFFLKISSNPESAQKLDIIQQSYLSRLGMEARYADTHRLIPQKNLPIITMIEKIFIFVNPKGLTKQIEVTHAAHGMLIRDVLKNYPDLIVSCGKSMGLALGSFQQAFMRYVDSKSPKTWKTACHNDLHLLNVLFDSKTSRIYFIDNESMSFGCSIEQDIDRVLFFFLMFTEFAKNNDSISWSRYITYSTSFIKGYIESFSLEKRVVLTEYLLSKIDTMARDGFWRQRISVTDYQSFYNAINSTLQTISFESLKKEAEIVYNLEQRNLKRAKEQEAKEKKAIILIPQGQELTSLVIKLDASDEKKHRLHYFDQLQRDIRMLPVSAQIEGKIKPYAPDNASQMRFVMRPAYTHSPIPMSSSGRYILEYSISNKKPIVLPITADSDVIIKKIA